MIPQKALEMAQDYVAAVEATLNRTDTAGTLAVITDGERTYFGAYSHISAQYPDMVHVAIQSRAFPSPVIETIRAARSDIPIIHANNLLTEGETRYVLRRDGTRFLPLTHEQQSYSATRK